MAADTRTAGNYSKLPVGEKNADRFDYNRAKVSDVEDNGSDESDNELFDRYKDGRQSGNFFDVVFFSWVLSLYLKFSLRHYLFT